MQYDTPSFLVMLFVSSNNCRNDFASLPFQSELPLCEKRLLERSRSNWEKRFSVSPVLEMRIRKFWEGI